MIIGKKNFQETGHTYVCGILNVTPDSFSDGGRFSELDKALFHVQEMVEQGAELIDVGGESTRPGYQMISDEEEIGRISPVIEAIKARFDVPISLDTYKAAVADAGIQAGADLINDIWGLKYDGKMAGVVAERGVPVCLMHNRKKPEYTHFMEDVVCDLAESVKLATDAGIADDRILLDPGVGFAKSYEQNLEIIRNMDMLKHLGYPILLGCSRKSVIGLTLDVPVNERLEGTLATTFWGVTHGAMFVRVHDIEANVRAIKMTEAIMGER